MTRKKRIEVDTIVVNPLNPRHLRAIQITYNKFQTTILP